MFFLQFYYFMHYMGKKILGNFKPQPIMRKLRFNIIIFTYGIILYEHIVHQSPIPVYYK